MQDRARVVIIGGGVHGASLLWHLTREGWTDVMLIEKAELTSGSTWHAAGQITRSVADYTTAAFHHYALELYQELPGMTGQEVSLHTPGGIRVAYNDDELDALKTHLGVGQYIGYPIELLGPDELAKINPYYNFDDVIAGIWTEGEGHVDPSGVTMAFANGARAAGATVMRRNRVLEVNQLPNGEWSVVTEQGTVACEHVVDAAGCYGDQVAALSGFIVPQANVLHHYLVTEELPAFAADLSWEMPVMRDNRAAGYIRQEQTAGLIGIYEHRGAEQIWADGVPWEAENPLFPADYDKIAPWLAEAFERVPLMGEVGIKRVVHGAITHTTDGHMLLGPAPGLRNYWLNTGSSIGLAWGPGAGRELARWIVHGETELSLRHYDPRRFGWADHDYIDPKAVEDYEWMFRVHPPGEERLANRPVRTSSLYEPLKAKRAMFTEFYGWEQPKWFVPEGQPLEDAHGWRRPSWYPAVREECRAVRERVGMMDLTAFSKYDVHGPDARAFLDRTTTGRIPGKDGRIALNYVLNDNARIETEITVTRISEDTYYLVSGAMGECRDFDWLNQSVAEGEEVTIEDRSTDRGVLVLVGPHARDVLSAVTDADVSAETFPFLSSKPMSIAGADVFALRVGFTGALGWELHMEVDRMQAVYDAMWAAGEAYGIADFGGHALNSLRIEKAYLTRNELTHDIGPVQAGVEFFVKRDKGDFVGREALDRPPTGNPWKLVYLELDVPAFDPATDTGQAGDGVADCVGGEGVFSADGIAVGLTTSGGYGFTVDKSLAFAYVTADHAEPGTQLGVLVLGEMQQATVLDGPVWDPENAHLRS
ncbi:MAG: FAD-dependent oxidoreductase [Actinomycetota bacterium]